MELRRPVMRYHGGKWRLAPWIIQHLPKNHRRYVEPFGGGGSVLMRKPRSAAEVYNDLDGEVVNVFRVLRCPESASELRRRVELTPFAREEFLHARESHGGPPAEPIERARLALIRSFMGFGSAGVNVYHATSFRNYSGPMRTAPAVDWRGWPEGVREYVDRLRGVIIENRAALDVIREHDDAETVFYVDPPYPFEVRGMRGRPRQRYATEMTADGHRELARVLRSARGRVVVSGYPCPLYDEELFPDWRRVTRQARTECAHLRTEVLWIN